MSLVGEQIAHATVGAPETSAEASPYAGCEPVVSCAATSLWAGSASRISSGRARDRVGPAQRSHRCANAERRLGRAALGRGMLPGDSRVGPSSANVPARSGACRTADSRHNLRRDGAAARPVLVRAGHAVGDVDPLRRDAERGEGVTLWVRFLFIAGDAGASEFEHRHRRGCRLASRHRDCSPNQSYGTRCPGRPRDWPLVKDGVGRGSGCGTVGGWMGSRGVSGGMTGLRQQLRKTVSRARRRCRPAVGRGRRA